MLQTYRTVSGSSQIEIEDRKSRFIATCRPLAEEAEALSFVGEIRQSYPDASHHAYAWILGGERNLQRYSDDGEPQGTAGLPVLEALRRQGIIQAGIVVTRYFGGTLLGTGGLVHNYGLAAAESVAAAKPVTMQLCELFRLVVGYGDLERLRRQLILAGAQLAGSTYGLDAELEAAILAGQGALLRQVVADASCGTALIEEAGLAYRPLPPPDPPAGLS
jgi:uncharacterized YigZ family protein